MRNPPVMLPFVDRTKAPSGTERPKTAAAELLQDKSGVRYLRPTRASNEQCYMMCDLLTQRHLAGGPVLCATAVGAAIEGLRPRR